MLFMLEKCSTDITTLHSQTQSQSIEIIEMFVYSLSRRIRIALISGVILYRCSRNVQVGKKSQHHIYRCAHVLIASCQRRCMVRSDRAIHSKFALHCPVLHFPHLHFRSCIFSATPNWVKIAHPFHSFLFVA